MQNSYDTIGQGLSRFSIFIPPQTRIMVSLYTKKPLPSIVQTSFISDGVHNSLPYML